MMFGIVGVGEKKGGYSVVGWEDTEGMICRCKHF